MGKKIDKFVLTVAVAGAFYLFFQRALGARIPSIALSLFCCLILLRMLRRLRSVFSGARWVQRRRARKHSSGAIMQLACMPEDEALAQLEALISKSYAGQYPLSLIQAHPATALSAQRVFEVWKANRGLERLVLCATCCADAACRALAESLTAPKLALVDAAALAQLIAEQPDIIAAPQEKVAKSRLRGRRALQALLSRRNVPRCLLFCAVMLLVYLLGGSIFYLISALGLLLTALLALNKPVKPAKLF